MKRIAISWILCAMAVMIMAKPAYRGPIVRVDENGNEQTVYLHGDESFHFLTDKTGQWLDEKTLRPLTETQKNARLDTAIAHKARRAPQQELVGGKPNIAPRGLLVLVNFQDVKFTTHKDTVDSMLNGSNFTRHYSFTHDNKEYEIISSGSARQYFIDQSWGQYQPVFDVVGPVTVSQDMAYYGANDASGNDKRPEVMVREACKIAHDDLGVDFSLYDNNNDDDVDFVYVIYAGYGEADGGSSNTIWPHSYNLSNTDNEIELNGKTVDKYACGCELSFYTKHYDGIGTFCHEFSHVLGLPDLYPTNGANHKTLGMWDLMDYGPYNNEGNTPPAYSAYERFYMGWLTPRVLKEPESVWLGFLNEDQQALIICQGDEHNLKGYNPYPTTFYMLENRLPQGWDAYNPGGALLITKIQYVATKWSSNTVNNSARSMGIDLIEADKIAPSYDKKNRDNGYFGKLSDVFPAGASEWTDFAGHEVTQIAQTGTGAIVFSYRGAQLTDIEQVESSQPATKILRDGKIIIIRDGVEYTVLGNRL